MTRSPVRRPIADSPDRPEAADGTGSRVDGWIAAALRKEAGDPARPADLAGVDGDTASALGSFASWIERAQKDLADSAQATIRAQQEATEVIKGTVGTLEERLASVEQRVGGGTADASGLQAPPSRRTFGTARDGEAASEFDASLRSFETRLGQLTERVSAAPRPAERRPPDHASEIRSAVAEIRSHQTRLDAAPARAERRTLPALGTLARSQTAILTSLKADIASLADRLETRSPPAYHAPAESAPEPAPGVAADLVTRDDLGRLEEGIRALTADIAGLRSATEAATGAPEIQALQAEIRRMAEQVRRPDETPSGRELELLSNKLDIVAASGVDPGAVETLARQVADIRHLLLESGASGSGVETHLAALRRDLAGFGERQVDPRDFATLVANVEDVRASLSGASAGSAGGHDVAARAVRDIGQPIETMLSALVDRLERIERRMADPEALHHLELQIGDLTARMGANASTDPALSSLERSMTDLMAQVSVWREGSVAMAEHAARTAVAEMAGSLPVAANLDRHLAAIRDRYEGGETKAGESLACVQSTLDEVMGRLARLETSPADARAMPAADPAAIVPPPRPSPRTAAAARVAAEPPSSSPRPAPAPDDEILLEPGAARPRRTAAREPAAAPGSDAQDLKANFIAAARRAAQAAAAESASPRKTSPAADTAGRPSILSPSELAGRVRQMIEAHRRPLLLGIAALVLAVGALHVLRNATTEAPAPAPPAASQASRLPPPPAVAPPVPARPAPASPATEAVPDPATTQALAGREPAGPADRTVPPPAPPAGGVDARAAPARPEARDTARTAAVPVAPVIAPPTLTSIPKPPQDQAPPVSAGLRQAASAGHPVALYELAIRTAEGRGVARDLKAAASLFQKAAEKNLVPAQYRTGNVYEKGVGVPRDVEAAKVWYRRAAESGNVRAMHNLAVLLAEGGDGKPDYAAALGWFTKAAEHGVRDSQFNLAVLHARGLGTAQDLAKTYFWLAVVAGQGDDDASRKRDEVGARLSAADLAKVKAGVERWKPGTPNPAANEVQFPATWPESAPPKRASGKEARL